MSAPRGIAKESAMFLLVFILGEGGSAAGEAVAFPSQGSGLLVAFLDFTLKTQSCPGAVQLQTGWVQR